MDVTWDTKAVRALRRDIRKLHPDHPEYRAQMKAANIQGAKVLESAAQANLSAGTRQQQRAASQVKARNAESGIGLRVAASGRVPYALAAIWGAKRHTGWYARKRYRASAGRQFPRWVGAGWEVGGPGGPYGINPAIRDHLDDVLDAWGEALGNLAESIGRT